MKRIEQTFNIYYQLYYVHIKNVVYMSSDMGYTFDKFSYEFHTSICSPFEFSHVH